MQITAKIVYGILVSSGYAKSCIVLQIPPAPIKYKRLWGAKPKRLKLFPERLLLIEIMIQSIMNMHDTNKRSRNWRWGIFMN